MPCLLNENLIAENKFRKKKLIRESDSHLASSARFHYKALSLNDDTYGGGSTLGGACEAGSESFFSSSRLNTALA